MGPLEEKLLKGKNVRGIKAAGSTQTGLFQHARQTISAQQTGERKERRRMLAGKISEGELDFCARHCLTRADRL